MAKAIFAGGCFWGMEELIRVRPGVLRTRVGYTGGHVSNPTYRMVCTKTTGHAEAIEIEYDNDLTSYRDLLEFFFKIFVTMVPIIHVFFSGRVGENVMGLAHAIKSKESKIIIIIGRA